MKKVKDLFLSLVLIAACMFASCSQDELFEPQTQVQNEDATTRAVHDMFNVEEIVFPEGTGLWYDAPRGVDNEGNFYLTMVDVDGTTYIYKYEVATGTFTPFFPFAEEAEFLDGERFCFDGNNNLCYIAYNFVSGKPSVRRIRADGNTVMNQYLDDISPISMDADRNGNLFILGYDSSGMKIFKLNTNGKLTEVGIDLSAIGSVNALYKANGAIIYLFGADYYSYNTTYCYKLNTNTGSIETFTLQTDWYISRHIASSSSKANPYKLNGNYLMQLRPNAASDLLVGTIPDSYKNANGQLVNTSLMDNSELFVNADATVFYTLSGIYSSWNESFYKLTLP